MKIAVICKIPPGVEFTILKKLLLLQLSALLLLAVPSRTMAGEPGKNLFCPYAPGAVLADVSGSVVDNNGRPMQGVTVKNLSTNKTVATNADGSFSIEAAVNDELEFSFVGYAARTIKVTVPQQSIRVVLTAAAADLSEVVVVGYGAVKKSDLTGAVSSVSSDKITQVKAVSNIAQALQGQAAGVQVNQASGQPGEFMVIKIRGRNSIDAGNEPLYVVDGFPTSGITAQLNPDDIARIEVLKDASATAIYGSRGANGVILITTKKGREGKTQVSYNGYFGVQTLRKKMELINAKEFARLQNEVAVNDGTPLKWTQAQIDSLGKGTDWQDLVYRPANVQNHDIAITGGSASTKFYTSFGYYNQDGIIENSNVKRLSFRVNLDQKISTRMSVSTSLSLQNTGLTAANHANADYGGVPFQAMVMPATVGVYDALGKYTTFTGVSWGQTNPVGMARDIWSPSSSLRILGNASLKYEIAKGLLLRVNAGIDDIRNKSDYYAPRTVTFGQPSGVASKTFSNGRSFVNENLLQYNKNMNDHAIELLGGITYQSNTSERLSSGDARDFITDIFQNNNIQSAITRAQPSTDYFSSKLVSYLGRVNYNYGERYFLTLTGRYDGSSVFGDDNKFAFFPSGALAWRVSKEDFMKNITAISNLKLRVSYGAAGNQAIAPYQALARINNTNVVFANQLNTAFIQGSLDNKELKWETTRQFDLGIDLGLLKDRIQLSADYYNKKTTDLLLNVTLPSSTGFGSVLKNIGAVQNRGFEFQVNSVNLTGPLSWTSTLTLSHNKTKVLDLGKDAAGNAITYKEVGPGGNWFPMILGQSMSQFYGHIVQGIYQTDQAAVDGGEPSKKAGDYQFKDLNGDKVVDDKDRTVLTRLEPKFSFGFNNSLEYKNFDLSLLFVGSYGNDVVNEFRKYAITMNGNWTPSKEMYEQRWRGAGTSNSVDKPSANSGSYVRDYANSLWVENGSYLRLRDITLGYTFSAKALRSVKISSARLYISAQNFLTLTSYSGYDPEAMWNITQVNGWDRGVYPSMKSVTVGTKVNF